MLILDQFCLDDLLRSRHSCTEIIIPPQSLNYHLGLVSWTTLMMNHPHLKTQIHQFDHLLTIVAVCHTHCTTTYRVPGNTIVLYFYHESSLVYIFKHGLHHLPPYLNDERPMFHIPVLTKCFLHTVQGTSFFHKLNMLHHSERIPKKITIALFVCEPRVGWGLRNILDIQAKHSLI